MKGIGIDLGTKNVLIYIKGKGIVLNEPSVIAIDVNTKKVLAVGHEASEMVGRTPGKVKAIMPMKDGVIDDFEMTEIMLNKFIKKAIGKSLLKKKKIVICCPTNITGIEKNAIKEMAERTGAKKVYVEEEVKVAAYGAGIDITKPSGSMVIDIGGGTTDIAILCLGGIANSSSIRIAGNKFDEDIINYVKDKHKLLIGEKTAEDIKIKIGTVIKPRKKLEMEVKGRDLTTGLPKTVTVTSVEVEEALRDNVKKIIKETKKVLETSLPELSADIVEKGIILTGGGSLIEGFPEILKENLNVPVFLSDSPLENVVNGTGILLDNIKLLEM